MKRRVSKRRVSKRSVSKRRVAKRSVSKRRVSKRRVSKRSKKKILKGGADETPKEIKLLSLSGFRDPKLLITDESVTLTYTDNGCKKEHKLTDQNIKFTDDETFKLKPRNDDVDQDDALIQRGEYDGRDFSRPDREEHTFILGIKTDEQIRFLDDVKNKIIDKIIILNNPLDESDITDAKLIIIRDGGNIILKYKKDSVASEKEITSENIRFNGNGTITITIKEEEEVYNEGGDLVGQGEAEEVTFSFAEIDQGGFELVKQMINPPSYGQALLDWVGL